MRSGSGGIYRIWIASPCTLYASRMRYGHDGYRRLRNHRSAAIQVHDGFVPIAGKYNPAAGQRFASGADITRIQSPGRRRREIGTAHDNSNRTGVHGDGEHLVSVGGIGAVETDRDLRADIFEGIADIGCVGKRNKDTRTAVGRTGVRFRIP